MVLHIPSAYLWFHKQKFKVLSIDEGSRIITIDPAGKGELFFNDEEEPSFLNHTGPGHRLVLEDFDSENNLLGIKVLDKTKNEVRLSYQIIYYFTKAYWQGKD